jgi:hypothetical protein
VADNVKQKDADEADFLTATIDKGALGEVQAIALDYGGVGERRLATEGDGLPVRVKEAALAEGASTADGQAAIVTAVGAATASLGTDGTTPPALPGGATGVRGFLRAILAQLTAGIGITGSVEVTNDAGPPLSVSAAALPLPSGAATGGNQDTTNSRLNTLIQQTGAVEASLTAIDTDIGALDSAPAPEDGSGNYSLNGAAKRLVASLATLLARIPALSGGRVPVAATMLADGMVRFENLLARSQEFENAVWTRANANVTANTSAAPDGTMTADTLTGTGAGATNFRQDVATTAATVTLSYFVKAGTAATCMLGDVNIGALGVFNLSTGAVTFGAGASITDAGNGWYRCAVTYAPTAGFARHTICPGSVYNGTTTASILIWGAQVNTGSVARVYAPTFATAITVDGFGAIGVVPLQPGPTQPISGTVSLASNSPTLQASANRVGFIAAHGHVFGDVSGPITANGVFEGIARDAQGAFSNPGLAHVGACFAEIRALYITDTAATLQIQVATISGGPYYTVESVATTVVNGFHVARATHLPIWRFWRVRIVQGPASATLSLCSSVMMAA